MQILELRRKAKGKQSKQLTVKMLDDAMMGLPDKGMGVDSGPFDSKHDVSHHPQREKLIGTGVCKFEVRFVNSWDHNMKQPRCDFIVHRTCGTAARLHPSSNSPG